MRDGIKNIKRYHKNEDEAVDKQKEKSVHDAALGRVINLAARYAEEGSTAVKKELSNIGVDARDNLKNDLKTLIESNLEDKKSKKVFKKIEAALPSRKKAEKNEARKSEEPM